MSPRIILSPDARADLESAAGWYRRENTDLSRRFEAEVWATLLRIVRHPNSFVRVGYVRVGNVRLDSVRRAVMARFPYSIYFTFRANRVHVIGIRHQRRADAVSSQRKNTWQADDD